MKPIELFLALLINIILALFVSEFAKRKKIGRNNAFLIGLLLSPVVSAIVIALSPEITETQPAASGSAADEIKKYKDLLDQGAITSDEYNAQKSRLMNM